MPASAAARVEAANAALTLILGPVMSLALEDEIYRAVTDGKVVVVAFQLPGWPALCLTYGNPWEQHNQPPSP